MASFSFGAGNARKLMRIPLYVAGRLATLVIPRSRDEWVFGCGVGVADGALALWPVVAAGGHRAVWLGDSARERADAAARGIPFVRRHSLQGFWRTARARVVVVTHGLGDVNRYAVAGAFVVQLWHGIPLKRIGLDSPETTRLSGRARPSLAAVVASRVLHELYRRTVSGIRVLPAASHLVRGRLQSAFALADGCVPVTGEPRVDVLSRGTAEERRSAARAGVVAAVGELSDDTRLVLYAPTWRDGQVDPAIPTPSEWKLLEEVLAANDAVLLIRSHPLGAGHYTPPAATPRVRLIGSDVVADVTPLLPALDALITDYSSLAFDAALVPLPVIYLAPDVEEYGSRRGFYGRFVDVAGEDWASDWTRAAADLGAVLGDAVEAERRRQRSRELSDRVHAFRDGSNTQRVYRAIQSRRGRRTPVGRIDARTGLTAGGSS
ncbi:CDP-glycerol glycerophosphotransferase family protein [Microbacterium sp. P02]|uniref:CDP-glycerol glycerophosphotransferase family protein n=1 Tax=Microbacterium sp. P02 TaxID=3366260 RepID=UPI00366CF0AD